MTDIFLCYRPAAKLDLSQKGSNRSNPKKTWPDHPFLALGLWPATQRDVALPNPFLPREPGPGGTWMSPITTWKMPGSSMFRFHHSFWHHKDDAFPGFPNVLGILGAINIYLLTRPKTSVFLPGCDSKMRYQKNMVKLNMDQNLWLPVPQGFVASSNPPDRSFRDVQHQTQAAQLRSLASGVIQPMETWSKHSLVEHWPGSRSGGLH